MPPSPATRALDFFNRKVGATTTIVCRLHQTLCAVNNRSSDVLPPRRRIVHVEVQTATSADSGDVTLCTIVTTRLNHSLIVVLHLFGTMSATANLLRV